MSALVGVIMGSKSDWSTLSHTADMLDKLGIPYEVVSAHRTPDLLFQYAEEAEGRGLEVIIAGAAAPPTCRACARPRPTCRYSACRYSRRCCRVSTRCSPSCRCPPAYRSPPWPSARPARSTRRCSASILGAKHPQYHEALKQFRANQTETVLDNPDPRDA